MLYRLTFQFNPSSKVYGFHTHDLKWDGENEDVNLDNVEEYIDLVMDFCFNSGIRRQLEAFKGKCKVYSQSIILDVMDSKQGSPNFQNFTCHTDNQISNCCCISEYFACPEKVFYLFRASGQVLLMNPAQSQG